MLRDFVSTFDHAVRAFFDEKLVAIGNWFETAFPILSFLWHVPGPFWFVFGYFVCVLSTRMRRDEVIIVVVALLSILFIARYML